jgi:hypothetical protein
MQHRHPIQVLCQAFGLYFLIVAAENLTDLILFVITSSQGDHNTSNFPFFSGLWFKVLAYAIAGGLLIRKSSTISNKVVQGSTGKVDLAVNKTDLIEIIIIGISFMIIIHAIPSIFNKTINYMYFNPYERDEKSKFWDAQNKAEIVYAVFKLFVGVVAVMNARLISRKLNQIGNKSDHIASGSTTPVGSTDADVEKGNASD